MKEKIPSTPRQVTCKFCKEKYKVKDTSWYKSGLEKLKHEPICKNCMEKYNILVADWEKQNTTNGYLCFPWHHIYYYQDWEKTCKSCHQKFIFSAQEQKFWYEEARIYTDVSPKMCLSCRKKSRELSPASEQIQKLLIQAEKEPSLQVFERLSKLYSGIDNKQKAGVYAAKAKRYRFYLKQQQETNEQKLEKLLLKAEKEPSKELYWEINQLYVKLGDKRNANMYANKAKKMKN